MKEKRMIRKLIAVGMAALMIGSAGLYVPGAMTGTGITANAASNVSINSQDVTIYCLSSYEKTLLTMPDEYPSEFQLEVSGAKSVYYTVQGNSVKVTKDGLIKPKRHVRIKNSLGYTEVWEDNYPDDDNLPEGVYSVYDTGSSTVIVHADGVKYPVKVFVKPYTQQYAENVMQKYIDENITSDMTDYAKMVKIAKFIAGYDYNSRYQSYTNMILYGGGDCWASANTAVKMATMLGYKALVRNGNNDPMTGEGHRNALVFTDSGYYVIEAGFSGKAPRDYSVTQKSSLYTYGYSSYYDGITVYQYDGEYDSEEFVIPSEFDGQPVTNIAEKFSENSFYTDRTKIKKVVLPETVKHIEANTFWDCENLEEINIPASLESASEYLFPGLTTIKKITSKSPRFKVCDDRLIYDDVNKCVISAPSIVNAVIPSDMKEISKYAFYQNGMLKSVKFPSGMESIKEGAFCEARNLKEIDLKNTNITCLDDACFYRCSNLNRVILPDNLKKIGIMAFSLCYSLESIIIPPSVEEISGDAFYYCNNLKVIYGVPGSAAEEFANNHSIEFREIKDVEAVSLNKSSITLAKGNTYMLNANFTPSDASDTYIEWKTGNSDIATVENGKIKAVGTGKVTILAKTSNGKTASCRVTVVNKLVNNSTVIANTVQVGDDIRLTAAAKGGTGEYQYAYYFKRSTNTNWTTLADFSTKKNAVLIPKAAADYDLKVVVKDKCGLKAEKTFTVKAVSSLALKNVSTVGSTSIKKGGSVRLYGKSIGGAKPVKYQFYFKRESNSTWKRLNASDENATSAKLTPSAAGVYDLKVTAIDAKGVKSEKTFKLTVK